MRNYRDDGDDDDDDVDERKVKNNTADETHWV